jgi:anti-anti-sigma factor
MEISVSHKQGRVSVAVIEIAGKTDSSSSDELLVKLLKVIDGGARYLLLEMSKMPYISSAGLRVLHEVFDKLRELAPEENEKEMYEKIRDGSFKSPNLKLLNPTKEVMEVLRMSGFDMLVSIENNRKEAIASF